MQRLTARQIAEDAIGLFLEYRDQHGQDEAQARASAVSEVLEAVDVEDELLTHEETNR